MFLQRLPMRFTRLRLVITVAGGLLLILSLLLSWQLYRQLRRYYTELNQTRLDPLGLSQYPVTSVPPRSPTKIRVVSFGDSRAENWQFPAQLPQTDYEWINRGISGQTSAQVRQRFIHHVQPLKPDVVVIQVGINDLKTIPLLPDQQAAIIANCQANIQHIVAATHAMGAVAIISTIFPVGEVPLARRLVWSDAIAPAVNQVNAYINSLRGDRTFVLDTVPLLANSQGVGLRQYQLDELHLNADGYTRLNQALLPLIQSIQPERAIQP